MQWPCVLGFLWDPVVHTPDLDALGMSFVWVIWTQLLYLGPDHYWPVCWWELPSGWLRGLTSTLSCMLFYRCWQDKENNTKTIPHHNSNINYRRTKPPGRKRNGIVEKRKKEKEYEKSRRKKSDYERRKGKRTNTSNKLKVENGEKEHREKQNNKKKEEGKMV